MTTWTHVVAAAAALIVLAGCSGSDERLSRDDYERRASPIVASLNDKIFKLGSAVTRAPAPRLAEVRIHNLRVAAEQASEALGELKPPEGVERQHTLLHEGVSELVPELEEAEAASRSPRYTRWPSFLDDLLATEAVKKVRRALAEMRERGYRIGS